MFNTNAVPAIGLLSPERTASNEPGQLVQSDSSQGHAFAKKVCNTPLFFTSY